MCRKYLFDGLHQQRSGKFENLKYAYFMGIYSENRNIP
jgi:hypothetical protein